MEKYLKPFLSQVEIDQIVDSSEKRLFNKKDYFITEGEVCKEVAFILSGTLRSFLISQKGDDITYCFSFPDSFLTAYSSYITGCPTEENIQAITPVELLVIPKEVLVEFEKTSINFTRFLKVMAEQQYLELEKRIFLLQRESANERYSNLLKKHPEYLQSIPLNYLSSYLNITQRHLSRIRKEIAY